VGQCGLGIFGSGRDGKWPFDGRFVKLDFWRSVEKAAEGRRTPRRFAPDCAPIKILLIEPDGDGAVEAFG
jgi:hypothetical protein